MDAVERLDRHQLGAQEPDAVDFERRGALRLRGLGEVDQQLRGGDGSYGAHDLPSAISPAARTRRITVLRDERGREVWGGAVQHHAVGGVDGHELSVAQRARGVAGSRDARDAELARDDRRVAGHATGVGHDRGGPRIRGTQSGVVMCATNTSPVAKASVSRGSSMSRTRPLADPGAAPRPRTSTTGSVAPAPASAVRPSPGLGAVLAWCPAHGTREARGGAVG